MYTMYIFIYGLHIFCHEQQRRGYSRRTRSNTTKAWGRTGEGAGTGTVKEQQQAPQKHASTKQITDK
jgi:hypothetical protein